MAGKVLVLAGFALLLVSAIYSWHASRAANLAQRKERLYPAVICVILAHACVAVSVFLMASGPKAAVLMAALLFVALRFYGHAQRLKEP